jgi:hypothetical protein
MFASIDFTASPAICYAFVASALMLPLLVLITRLSFFHGKNALQFLITFCVTIASWCIAVLYVGTFSGGDSPVSLMIIGCASLIYLEAWALFSRGYTLGLLLTLHRAGRPLDEKELAENYRGGDGLSWIMEHRLRGLKSFGLVTMIDDKIVLTPALGVPVAWVYKLILRVLGLRKTG